MKLSRALALVVVLFATGQALATNCYQYRVSASLPWNDSASGALSDYATSLCSADHTKISCAAGSTTGSNPVTGGTVTYGFNYGNYGTITVSVGLQTQTKVCPPTPCSDKAGKTYDTVVLDAPPVSSGTGVHGADGCEYTVTGSPTNVIGQCAGGMCAIQTMVATGEATPENSSGPAASPGDCFGSSDGSATCSEAAPQDGSGAGKNCGTFNGDEVCVASIPPGTCQSYASGGVACTAAAGSSGIPSPPGPNSGVANDPAQPTGTLQTGSSTGATTTNYYNSTVVHGSTSPVATSSGGANVGNGTGATGSSSGGGGGGGNAPNGANGDCGASGVACAADGSVPTFATVPTIQQSANTYAGALGAVPVVAAVSAISASVPAGECPTASLALFGHSYVIDAQCSLWEQVSSIVGLCMLAVWTFIGVRIVMSA